MVHESVLELALEMADGEREHEVIVDRDSMTVEIGKYPGDTTELRNPHTEDEIYYIIEGEGKIRVGDTVHDVKAGDMVFVERGTEHDFFDIREPITTLIVLAGKEEHSSYAIRDS
ncbi:cupin domain-containing protein [Salinarchaeum sp. IM2453]|uniref:cupin domain-containing protein n=1 Tax=Salinarchaeum sp. IM2453 TaxID=2862870 RepID=UPI001C83AC25|nr:cupin domain-containing protein [Salinarchaeum sp. IM2453]QZA88434.1 cupin domain-containing protein [Salinarchaeum sp. IM2453]